MNYYFLSIFVVFTNLFLHQYGFLIKAQELFFYYFYGAILGIVSILLLLKFLLKRKWIFKRNFFIFNQSNISLIVIHFFLGAILFTYLYTQYPKTQISSSPNNNINIYDTDTYTAKIIENKEWQRNAIVLHLKLLYKKNKKGIKKHFQKDTKIIVKSYYELGDLKKDDVITFNLYRLWRTKDFEESSYKKYLLQNNFIATAYTTPKKILKHHQPKKRPFSTDAYYYIKNRINQYVQAPANGLSIAMLTGDKNFIPSEVKQDFRMTGIYHVLAISGLHASIIVLILFFVLNSFFRMSKKKSIGLILLIIFPLYLYITNFPISLIRTYAMACLGYLFYLLNRKVSLFHLLAVTFLGVILINPKSFFDISFQLSFSAVWGIFLAIKIITNYKIKNPVAQYVMVSIITQIVTSPLLIYYFGYLNFYALFYNILIVLIFIPLSLIYSFILIILPLPSLSLLPKILPLDFSMAVTKIIQFIFTALDYVCMALGKTITIINHFIFFLLSKTKYSHDWFYLSQKNNFLFNFLLMMGFILTFHFVIILSKRRGGKRGDFELKK